MSCDRRTEHLERFCGVGGHAAGTIGHQGRELGETHRKDDGRHDTEREHRDRRGTHGLHGRWADTRHEDGAGEPDHKRAAPVCLPLQSLLSLEHGFSRFHRGRPHGLAVYEKA